MDKRRIPSDLNLVLGVWLIVAPFALGYAYFEAAMWNSIVVGLLVAAFAAWRGFGHAGGWAAWANVILGAWLLASPWMFGHAAIQAALFNDVIVGAAIGALALASAFALRHNEETWGKGQVFASAEPDERDRFMAERARHDHLGHEDLSGEYHTIDRDEWRR
ncbi:MAG: SPW repeat protein [Candidatus Sericytochromatia bacterium]